MHLQVRGASRRYDVAREHVAACKVLMHLQVRGASRRAPWRADGAVPRVLMHLQVRGASRLECGKLCGNHPVLMHLQVRGASRPPGSGTGVMTPLPGPGAPPTPQAPRGTGQHRAQITTFPCNHAKRHRRRPHPLQRTTADDAMRKSRGRNQDLSPAVRVGHSRSPFPSSKMNSLPRSRLHQALAQTLVRTDLDAEMNRSRAGIRPISAKGGSEWAAHRRRPRAAGRRATSRPR